MKNNLLLAALAILALSCTKASAPKATTVHITVGADIDQTKSIVEKVDGVRTLQFAKGDRLYVRARVTNSYVPNDGYYDVSGEPNHYYGYIVAGYLNLDDITVDGTGATFSGDLPVYSAHCEMWEDEIYIHNWIEEYVGDDEEGNPIFEQNDEGNYQTVTITDYTYPKENLVKDITGIFANPAAPLNECEYVYAYLVHEDAGKRFHIYDEVDQSAYYLNRLAADVESLMTTTLTVSGYYLPSTRCFNLRVNLPPAHP